MSADVSRLLSRRFSVVLRFCRVAFGRRRTGLETQHLDWNYMNVRVHRLFEFCRQVLLKYASTPLKIFCSDRGRETIENNVKLIAPICDGNGLDFRFVGKNVGPFSWKRGDQPERGALHIKFVKPPDCWLATRRYQSMAEWPSKSRRWITTTSSRLRLVSRMPKGGSRQKCD